MSASSFAERIQRPLVGIVAAVLTAASVCAVVVDPAPAGVDAGRAGVADAPAATAPPPASDGEQAPPPDDGTIAPEQPDAGGPEPADPAPLGPSAVPAAGVHRYEVRTTTGDGEPVVEEERREIEVLSGDRTAGTVRVTARLGGESQVSVIDWSPSGALVRSTRIESSAGPGEDCTWEPPFPELGALAEGATWDIDSTCRTPVAGIDTVFTITGQGRVLGETTVASGDADLRVWEIRRTRTTTIEADIGGTRQQQRAREEGTLLLDPARGVVVRSDVTVTLEGVQSGVTRRVSVLQP